MFNPPTICGGCETERVVQTNMLRCEFRSVASLSPVAQSTVSPHPSPHVSPHPSQDQIGLSPSLDTNQDTIVPKQLQVGSRSGTDPPSCPDLGSAGGLKAARMCSPDFYWNLLYISKIHTYLRMKQNTVDFHSTISEHFFLGDLRSLVRFVSFWKKRAKSE